MLDAINQARVESQQPPLAITDILPWKVCETFRLKWIRDQGQIWHSTPSQKKPFPEHLRLSPSPRCLETRILLTNTGLYLQDHQLSVGDALGTKAAMRIRIDAVLVAALASAKRESVQSTAYKALHISCSTHLSFPWLYKGKPRTLIGTIDYALWYGSRDEAETNLVVMQAPRFGAVSKWQVLSYMGMYIFPSLPCPMAQKNSPES